MLHPTTATLRSFVDSFPPCGQYRLSSTSLDIPDAETAVFKATLHGPTGAQVWARAWLWNDIDNTLAEAASPPMTSGDQVTLTVTLKDVRTPDHASMRIESSPLATEHVVRIKLPQEPMHRKDMT
jgi:hypothetical protein